MHHITIFVAVWKLTFDDLRMTWPMFFALYVLDIHSLFKVMDSVSKNDLKTCVTQLCAFISQTWPLVTSGDLTFDLTYKMTDIFSKCFLTIYRTPHTLFSLGGLGAKLERGGVQTPPPSRSGNPGPPAGRGLIRSPCILMYAIMYAIANISRIRKLYSLLTPKYGLSNEWLLYISVNVHII